MTKPIFLIGLPKGTNPKQVASIQKNLERKMNDYHILIFTTNNVDIEFKAFFENNFSKVKYEELKRIVSESVSK